MFFRCFFLLFFLVSFLAFLCFLVFLWVAAPNKRRDSPSNEEARRYLEQVLPEEYKIKSVRVFSDDISFREFEAECVIDGSNELVKIGITYIYPNNFMFAYDEEYFPTRYYRKNKEGGRDYSKSVDRGRSENCEKRD